MKKPLQLFSSSSHGEEQQTKPPSSSPETFTSSIAKIAVAQICRYMGFSRSQSSALEALSNIATRYLQTMASYASASANFSGRTQCNLFDVIVAIEGMNSIQGFKGGSDIRRCSMKSGVLVDLMKFVSCFDEIPFAKPIPCWNWRRKKSGFCSWKQVGCQEQVQLMTHIPPWLPCLPDPSTYREMGVGECSRDGNEWLIGGDNRDGLDDDRRIIDGFVAEKREDWEGKRILPVEREKVRFKIGLGCNVEVDLRSGVCKGGKRVSWHNRCSDEIDEESSKSSSSCKRRKQIA